MGKVRRCAYLKCNNTSEHIKVFRFPVKHKDRLKIWIENSGNKLLELLNPNDLRFQYVCADHFPEEDGESRKSIPSNDPFEAQMLEEAIKDLQTNSKKQKPKKKQPKTKPTGNKDSLTSTSSNTTNILLPSENGTNSQPTNSLALSELYPYLVASNADIPPVPSVPGDETLCLIEQPNSANNQTVNQPTKKPENTLVRVGSPEISSTSAGEPLEHPYRDTIFDGKIDKIQPSQVHNIIGQREDEIILPTATNSEEDPLTCANEQLQAALQDLAVVLKTETDETMGDTQVPADDTYNSGCRDDIEANTTIVQNNPKDVNVQTYTHNSLAQHHENVQPYSKENNKRKFSFFKANKSNSLNARAKKSKLVDRSYIREKKTSVKCNKLTRLKDLRIQNKGGKANQNLNIPRNSSRDMYDTQQISNLDSEASRVMLSYDHDSKDLGIFRLDQNDVILEYLNVKCTEDSGVLSIDENCRHLVTKYFDPNKVLHINCSCWFDGTITTCLKTVPGESRKKYRCTWVSCTCCRNIGSYKSFSLNSNRINTCCCKRKTTPFENASPSNNQVKSGTEQDKKLAVPIGLIELMQSLRISINDGELVATFDSSVFYSLKRWSRWAKYST